MVKTYQEWVSACRSILFTTGRIEEVWRSRGSLQMKVQVIMGLLSLLEDQLLSISIDKPSFLSFNFNGIDDKELLAWVLEVVSWRGDFEASMGKDGV